MLALILIVAWAARLSADDARPLVAVIADNEGSEVPDFIVPYGVLSASGAVQVVDVSVHDGPVQMMPASKLSAKETIASLKCAARLDSRASNALLDTFPVSLHSQGLRERKRA